MVSIRVRDVPSDDIAYACSDTTCKVDAQVCEEAIHAVSAQI